MLAETEKSAVMDDSFTDLQASVKLLESAAKSFHLPIQNQFNENKISEISNRLENRRKELEKDLDSVQPKLKVADADKSPYM